MPRPTPQRSSCLTDDGARVPIKFGTDGWRALVGEEFTFPNVRAVTQAVADYLKRHRFPSRPLQVIVGYDTRPLSDRFAFAVAEVFAGNRFEVLLTEEPMPTPAVSFAIRKWRLQGGIVVTASHNPFTYNGLKFKPHYAGPAEAQMTQWIEKRLFKGRVNRLPLEEGLRGKQIRWVDLKPLYLDFLHRYVHGLLLGKARFRVGYDSMKGAGQDLLKELLQGSASQVIPVEETQMWTPSSHRPEPVGEHLKKLSAWVKKHRCDIGLATDGDADRAGVVGPDGRFVSSQETMALLVWHLLENRGWRGLIVSTVAGTNLLDRIAAQYGVELTRTPVGFKHIARLMREKEVLFGGEESGGFGFKGCVPERDGLLAGLLVLEMMAIRGKGLLALLGELRRRFGHWVYGRADLALEEPMDPKRLLPWAKGLTDSPSPFPSPLRGEGRVRGKIREVQTLDGVKLILEDRSWLLLRPSGTEPLLRIYAEAHRPSQLRTLLKAGQRMGRQIVAAS